MRIKNWKKFQHFKDRRPPWIKFHREILEDRELHEIPAESYRLLTFLWLIASEAPGMDGALPSVADIAWRLRISEKDAKARISTLSKWVEQRDIYPISKRYQNDLPEIEIEIEKETEKITPKNGVVVSFEPEKQKDLTTIQKVVRAWKIQSGNEPDDAAWDKVHFAANAAHAKRLLELFGGDANAAIDCIEDRWAQIVTKQGLSLSLAGVVKASDVFRQRWQEQKAKREGALN